jgi:hypothetical protein
MRTTTRSAARRLPIPVVGSDILELLVHIVEAHPEIEALFFARPKLRPPPHVRPGLSELDSRFVRNAKERWREPIPFWDAIMLSIISSGDVPRNVLRLAAFNHPISETQFPVEAKDLGSEKIKTLTKAEHGADPLAICSKVKLEGGKTRYIPMMDFRSPKSEHCLSAVSEIAKLLEVGPGYVLETDKSYHFYGTELLTASEQTAFLARALLFSPIVDRAWIAHQLIDMCCNLRVASRSADGKTPHIVAVVN